jgi:hypothetical protein
MLNFKRMIRNVHCCIAFCHGIYCDASGRVILTSIILNSYMFINGWPCQIDLRAFTEGFSARVEAMLSWINLCEGTVSRDFIFFSLS